MSKSVDRHLTPGSRLTAGEALRRIAGPYPEEAELLEREVERLRSFQTFFGRPEVPEYELPEPEPCTDEVPGHDAPGCCDFVCDGVRVRTQVAKSRPRHPNGQPNPGGSFCVHVRASAIDRRGRELSDDWERSSIVVHAGNVSAGGSIADQIETLRRLAVESAVRHRRAKVEYEQRLGEIPEEPEE